MNIYHYIKLNKKTGQGFLPLNLFYKESLPRTKIYQKHNAKPGSDKCPEIIVPDDTELTVIVHLLQP